MTDEPKFTHEQYLKALLELTDHLTDQGRELRTKYLKTLEPYDLKLEAQTYADGTAWGALCGTAVS